MRRDRVAKVQAAMRAAGVETLVCCGQANVSYLTGARVPAADHARASAWRSVAVLGADATAPVLFTAFPEGAPDGTDLHAWCAVETDAARARARRHAPAGGIAIDDAPFPLWTALGERDSARREPRCSAPRS